jgi:hypothetical protein
MVHIRPSRPEIVGRQWSKSNGRYLMQAGFGGARRSSALSQKQHNAALRITKQSAAIPAAGPAQPVEQGFEQRRLRAGFRGGAQRGRGVGLGGQKRADLPTRLIEPVGMRVGRRDVGVMSAMPRRHVAERGDGLVVTLRVKERAVADFPEPRRRRGIVLHRRFQTLRRLGSLVDPNQQLARSTAMYTSLGLRRTARLKCISARSHFRWC